MKQKDIIIIIATVFISGIFSYVICNSVLFGSKDQKQTAQVVQPIVSDFKLPDKKIFNIDAVNPTTLIQIGPNSNEQPFAKQ